jgi:hypothetical protein
VDHLPHQFVAAAAQLAILVMEDHQYLTSPVGLVLVVAVVVALLKT